MNLHEKTFAQAMKSVGQDLMRNPVEPAHVEAFISGIKSTLWIVLCIMCRVLVIALLPIMWPLLTWAARKDSALQEIQQEEASRKFYEQYNRATHPASSTAAKGEK